MYTESSWWWQRTIAVLVWLLVATPAFPDCDAPALSFDPVDGAIHGTTVRKHLETDSSHTDQASSNTVIAFGDYRWQLSSPRGGKKPTQVEFDADTAADRLAQSFQVGEHYLGTEVPKFSVVGTAAYDLDGDSREDLIFFDVSTGANVYSGVIGVTGGRWVTVIEPTCY